MYLLGTCSQEKKVHLHLGDQQQDSAPPNIRTCAKTLRGCLKPHGTNSISKLSAIKTNLIKIATNGLAGKNTYSVIHWGKGLPHGPGQTQRDSAT